jgi:hypothetical protein
MRIGIGFSSRLSDPGEANCQGLVKTEALGRDSAPVFIPLQRDYAEASPRVPEIRCKADTSGSFMVIYHGISGNAAERVPTLQMPPLERCDSGTHASASATDSQRELTFAATQWGWVVDSWTRTRIKRRLGLSGGVSSKPRHAE